MSPLDDGVIRNKGSKVMIMCQLIGNTSTEGFVQVPWASKTSVITQQKDPLWQGYTIQEIEDPLALPILLKIGVIF